MHACTSPPCCFTPVQVFVRPAEVSGTQASVHMPALAQLAAEVEQLQQEKQRADCTGELLANSSAKYLRYTHTQYPTLPSPCTHPPPPPSHQPPAHPPTHTHMPAHPPAHQPTHASAHQPTIRSTHSLPSPTHPTHTCHLSSTRPGAVRGCCCVSAPLFCLSQPGGRGCHSRCLGHLFCCNSSREGTTRWAEGGGGRLGLGWPGLATLHLLHSAG